MDGQRLLLYLSRTDVKFQIIEYRQSPYLWATLTDGGPPFFPAAWPAQLCHQGSNSLLPRQVAHRLSKCLGPPLGIFTRPLWPWNDLTFGQNILWVHICKHKFFRIFSCSQRVQKLRSKIALLLEKIIFVELDGTYFSSLQAVLHIFLIGA